MADRDVFFIFRGFNLKRLCQKTYSSVAEIWKPVIIGLESPTDSSHAKYPPAFALSTSVRYGGTCAVINKLFLPASAKLQVRFHSNRICLVEAFQSRFPAYADQKAGVLRTRILVVGVGSDCLATAELHLDVFCSVRR